MAQEMIKCPKCGETDLKMASGGVYVCPICATKIQDNKIQEILDLLKSRPETYVGNARFRLRRELKADEDETDFEIVAKQADRILEEDPEDVLANFYLLLAKREKSDKSRERYRKNLIKLAKEDLEGYQAKQIVEEAVKFYASYEKEKEAICAFLDAHGAKLPHAKSIYVKQMDEKDEELEDESEAEKFRLLSRKKAEIRKLMDLGQTSKAIRKIEDALLDDDCDEKALRKMLLQAQADEGIVDTKEGKMNISWLKKACTATEFAALEEDYPCLIDDKRSLEKGLKLFADKRFAEALPCFEKAAKKGNVDALYKLGEMHFVGRGVDRDPARGVGYYEEAAKKGNVEACRMLGVAYAMGNGAPRDEKKSHEYFLAGAKKGNAFCQCKAAKNFMDGVGTKENPLEGFRWYMKAAEQGSVDGIRELGYCYKYGNGTDVNLDYAKECFLKASEMGDLEAKREIRGF
ncbi:MAG: sel1 repeat family protein [Clostridia bacterium]|nr:sel1 repeat family protein [Clostridia bacterium]